MALPSQVWAHPYPTLPTHVRGRRSFSCAVLFCSFPMRCVALHFFSKALLGISSPRRCSAIQFRCDALLFFSKALPCFSFPVRRAAHPAHCGCKHCRSYAAYCISFALPYLAVPIRGISLLCTAPLCLCQAKHCLAKHCQCLVLLFYSAATHSSSQRCLSVSGPLSARLFRRLSAWTIACADISPW